jgi:Domain of unknown function (DUF5911)
MAKNTGAGRGKAPAATPRQSAAMPSPFPPIADYAFLSDCHTGALVAPDGAVDWLCVPRFDSPSIFGSLIDRQAGTFRFGPYGINVPTSVAYEPGTNVLVTTWKTPSGWIVVRDALTVGTRQGPDQITPHTRPRRTMTQTTRSYGRHTVWLGRSRSSSSANLSSTTGRSQPIGPSSMPTATRPMRPGPSIRSGCRQTSRLGSRAIVSGLVT